MRARGAGRLRRRLRAAAGAGDRRDAGLSLSELLVVMAISSSMLVVLAGVYISGLRTTSTVTAKVSATADVALATDVISRRLRVAVAPSNGVAAVSVASASSISFYASLATGAQAAVDPVPTLVTYRYDPGGQCLTETLTPGQGSAAPYTWPASGARTTCLVRGTVTGGGTDMFTYYSSATGTTTTATPSAVRSVGVSLAATQTSGAASATTRDGARVVLENLGA